MVPGGGRTKSWQDSCKSLLLKLMQLDRDGWFCQPVDPVELGIEDYYDVIKQPMDLATIKDKLARASFKDPAAFARDVRLVFNNAMLYNESPDHDVHIAANKLLQTFEQAFKIIHTENSNQGNPEPPRQKPQGAQEKKEVHPFFARRRRVPTAAHDAQPEGNASVGAGPGQVQGQEEKEEDPASTTRSSCAGGGSGPMRELSDEELLATANFWLNKAQKKRKDQLLLDHREQVEKERRKQEIANINRGRDATHPFFVERAKGATSAAAASDGCPLGSGTSWVAPLFPSIPCVFADVLDAPEANSTSSSDCLRPTACVAPAPFQVEVVDLEQEEVMEAEVRRLLLSKGALSSSEAVSSELTLLAQRLTPLLPLQPQTAREVMRCLAEQAGVEPLVAEMAAAAKRRTSQHDQGLTATMSLWVDRFRPNDQGIELIGLQKTSAALQQWLSRWKAIPVESGDYSCATTRKRGRRRRRHQESDDEDEAAEEEEGGLLSPEDYSAAAIIGPSGSGKSALAYYVAEKLGFNVIEINTGQLRSGAELKKLFSEATQSQHILDSAASESPWVHTRNDSMGASDGEVSDVEIVETRGGCTSRRGVLMLIEEADLIFEEDAGFHRALRELITSAKCPILLTANDSLPWMEKHCFLARVKVPSAERLALLLSTIWASQIHLPALPAPVFSELSHLHACDIRSSIMALQLWATRLPQWLGSLVVDGERTTAASNSLLGPAPPDVHLNATTSGPPCILGYAIPLVSRVKPSSIRWAGGGGQGARIRRVSVLGRNFLQRSCWSGEEEQSWAPVSVKIGAWYSSEDVVVVSDTELDVGLPESLPMGIHGVTVVVCGVAMSSLAPAKCSAAALRVYQDQQPRITERLFPELRVPRSSSSTRSGGPDTAAPAAPLTTSNSSSIDEETSDEGGAAAAAAASIGTPAMERSPPLMASGSASEEAERSEGGASKRRRVVVESDEEEEQPQQQQQHVPSTTAPRDGAQVRGTPPPAVASVGGISMSSEGSSSHLDTSRELCVEEPGGEAGEYEGEKDTNGVPRLIEDLGAPCDALEAAAASRGHVEPRVFRVSYKRPDDAASRDELQELVSLTAELSACSHVSNFAPQLSGDEYVCFPGSTRALDMPCWRLQDPEASPWPAVAGAGSSVAAAALELIASQHQQQAVMVRARQDFSADTDKCLQLKCHTEALLQLVLRPLLPLSFSNPPPNLLHLDYLPHLQIMTRLDDDNVAASKQRRERRSRYKSYMTLLTSSTPPHDMTYLRSCAAARWWASVQQDVQSQEKD